ncbi:transposase [Streptomyces sp. NPDC057302]|uniref:transposase n=1 Tax=Streptomyces sp. NPDC057302 TaxID=3346094 RepID=UPI0036255C89
MDVGRCTIPRHKHLQAAVLVIPAEPVSHSWIHAPRLLAPVGIGPDSAVTLLIIMGGNPERLHTEASFAALCEVSPVECSSGRRSSRRLNHGGDRKANAALHRIVFTRLRHDRARRRTANAAPGRAKPVVRSSGASSDMPPARYPTWSKRYPATPCRPGAGRGPQRSPPARSDCTGAVFVGTLSVCCGRHGQAGWRPGRS